MSLLTHTGTFNKITGTGPQTISGVGFTPVVVIFWSVLTTAGNATFTGADVWSTGFDTGSVRRGQAMQSDNGSTPSIVATGSNTSYSVIDRAAFLLGRISSITTDGFVFNWTLAGLDTEANGATIHYLVLGGSGVSASVIDVNTTLITGNHSYTGAGFQPDALIAIGFQSASCINTVGFGVSSSLQCSMAAMSVNAVNPSNTGSYQRSNKFTTAISPSDPSIIIDETAIVSLDSDGFTLNHTSASGNGGWSVLCLKGVSASVGVLNQPTTTGSQSISTPGVVPRCALFASFGAAATTSPVSQARASFGASDGINQGGVWRGDNDNVNPTSGARYDHASRAITLAAPSTISAQAAVTSLDSSGGFTLNWLTVDATARQVMWMVLGDPSATPAPPPTGSDYPCAIITPRYFAALKVAQGGGFTTYTGSKAPLRNPSTYYGGYWAPRLDKISGVIRAASDYKSGATQVQSAEIRWSDFDYQKRTAMGTYRADFTGSELWLYLISEAQRLAFGTPRLLFYGKLYEDPLDSDLGYITRANDLIGVNFSLLKRDIQIPRRTTRADDFPNITQPQRGLGVPIIGGEVSNSTTGAIKLIDVGDFVCADSVTRRCLLVAGHACKETMALYQGPALAPTLIPGGDYGTTVWAHGQTGWTTVNPSNQAFFDINSNRYSLVFISGARVTDFDNGNYIYADIKGMEDVGDGTGTLITDLLKLYKHLMVNWFIGDYHTGPWLASPTFTFDPFTGANVALIDESSWDTASTLAGTILGGGYIGAFVLGANGRRRSLQQEVSDANVSVTGVISQSGDNQLFIKLLNRNRSAFIGSATASNWKRHILSNPRFNIAQNREWLGTEMSAQYQQGYRDDGVEWEAVYETGRAPSEDRYDQIIINDGYTLIRDAATAAAVANQRMDFMAELPRIVTWKESLCGLRNDIMSGLELTHYSGPSSVGYVNRAMWVIRQVINPEESSVTITAVDVENLLS